MKRSSIKILEESTIGKEFIGKHETTFINNKENIRKVEEEMFTLLYVNVRNKELYTAFE
jgi:ubiquitin carboxyl-terminal hydrolase 25/28